MTSNYLNRYHFDDEDIVFEDEVYIIVDKGIGSLVYVVYTRTNKGLQEIGTYESLERALDELIELGSTDAGDFRAYLKEESKANPEDLIDSEEY